MPGADAHAPDENESPSAMTPRSVRRGDEGVPQVRKPSIMRGSAARPDSPANPPSGGTNAAPSTPRPAAPFDPHALEERLREARTRRDAALAARAAGGGHPDAPATDRWRPAIDGRPAKTPRPVPPRADAPAAQAPALPRPEPRDAPAVPVRPAPVETRPNPAPPRAEPLVAPPRAPQPPKRRPARWLLPLLFIAGMGLGAGAIFLAPPALRERAYELLALEQPGPEPVTTPPETSPDPLEPVADSQPLRVATVDPATAPPDAPPALAADRQRPPAPLVLAEPTPPPSVPAAEGTSVTQPSRPDLAPAAQAEEPPAVARATAVPPRAAPARPSATSERVYVHVPRQVSAAMTERVAASLREAGFAEVLTVPVDLAISRTNVRFYYDADGRAANRAVAVLNASLDLQPPQVRDFTTFLPLPASGTIEVWLEGQATAPAEPVRAQTPATPAGLTVAQRRAAEAAEIQRLVDSAIAPRAAPAPAHPFGRLGEEIDRAVDRFATGRD